MMNLIRKLDFAIWFSRRAAPASKRERVRYFLAAWRAG